MRVIINWDGTMFPADTARIVEITPEMAETLLDVSDSERWAYAQKNGEAI